MWNRTYERVRDVVLAKRERTLPELLLYRETHTTGSLKKVEYEENIYFLKNICCSIPTRSILEKEDYSVNEERQLNVSKCVNLT